MITRFNIDEDTINLAESWSDFKGNKFSIRNDGTKMIVSNLAEICFSRQYPTAVRISDKDYNADFTLKGYRIDVKCKERAVYCREDYDVSVEARQMEYDVDWYMFYSYNSKANVMEFLGGMSKEEYKSKARLYRKGDVLDGNNWKVSVDCYNLKISQLRS